MSERTMSNVREKLSKSREMCPGLSEEVYALTDYMAKAANDELVPQGLAMCFALSMEDIRRGENGFAFAESKEIPEYLAKHKTQVLAQAVYVPQIIDAIADEDFANEFREICKEMLHFDPPRREEKYNQNAEIEGDYPEYVKVAVNWWANAIVNPKFDNGDDSTAGAMTFLLAMMVNSKSSISKEQVSIFKKELAQLIVTEMESSWNGECQLGVDYHPDMLLYTAAQKAGINDNMGFPWKTNMCISKEKVSVSAGYAASWKTLWEKDMTMSNLRERLSKSREMCPGLSEEVYALTDYMAMLADSDPSAASEPRDTAFSLFICIENIKAGKSGAVVPDIAEFPEYFIEHKEQALAEAVHVPKVIGAVTDEDFANKFENEFHNICKEREKALS